MLDGDGRLHFRRRIKEMVKTGGINVAPLEVEEVLLGHASVEQAYVIGEVRVGEPGVEFE